MFHSISLSQQQQHRNMPFSRLAGLTVVASAMCGVAQAQTCTNSDYQVKVYRYTDTSCSADETIATYQSKSVVRESSTKYKTFTCCDDKASVTVASVSGTITTSSTVQANDFCLTGDAADTGAEGTDKNIVSGSTHTVHPATKKYVPPSFWRC